MLHILASDFSGLAPFILGAPIVLLMALVSFIPSSRGHWSGPVLAAPLILLGAVFICMQADMDELPATTWSFLLAPVAIGAASVVVWVARRKRATH